MASGNTAQPSAELEIVPLPHQPPHPRGAAFAREGAQEVTQGKERVANEGDTHPHPGLSLEGEGENGEDEGEIHECK